MLAKGGKYLGDRRSIFRRGRAWASGNVNEGIRFRAAPVAETHYLSEIFRLYAPPDPQRLRTFRNGLFLLRPATSHGDTQAGRILLLSAATLSDKEGCTPYRAGRAE